MAEVERNTIFVSGVTTPQATLSPLKNKPFYNWKIYFDFNFCVLKIRFVVSICRPVFKRFISWIRFVKICFQNYSICFDSEGFVYESRNLKIYTSQGKLCCIKVEIEIRSCLGLKTGYFVWWSVDYLFSESTIHAINIRNHLIWIQLRLSSTYVTYLWTIFHLPVPTFLGPDTWQFPGKFRLFCLGKRRC